MNDHKAFQNKIKNLFFKKTTMNEEHWKSTTVNT